MHTTQFTQYIIQWYQKAHRDLPWRKTKNPYHIWLSEIILQQTRVKQGLPYYIRFVETYPTVFDFAQADIQEILRLWQGLGYYSRARNMHHTANYICEHLDGQFPSSYAELLKLKGIGKYTAAAIASFAYGEPVAVLDGNVFRVLARYFGIDTDIGSTKGQKEFEALAQDILPKNQAAVYNQAIMEFGAMLCSPQKPNCMFCSLQTDCVAYTHHQTASLPVKIKKTKQKKRFFNYVVWVNEAEEVALRQRQGKDIWQGLYDFDLIESSDFLGEEALLERLPCTEGICLEAVSNDLKHVLTHQVIYARFWKIKILSNFAPEMYLPLLRFYEVEEIKNLPKPILIHNYLDKYFF